MIRRHLIVIRGGQMVRERPTPEIVEREARCPYCFDRVKGPGYFCRPEHARRFHAHTQNVKRGRERAIERRLELLRAGSAP